MHILWAIAPFDQFLSDSSNCIVDFQHCMYNAFGDSLRDKWSKWLCTHSVFSALHRTCDGSHKHLPWGVARSGNQWTFATAQEAEYPLELCKLVAVIVLQEGLDRGAVQIARHLADIGFTQDQKTKRSRTMVGIQPRGRVLPPIMTEYKEIRVVGREDLPTLPPYKLLRESALPRTGVDAGKQPVVVGLYRSPSEFLEEAKTIRHPMDMPSVVRDELKVALFNLSVQGVQKTVAKRMNFIKQLQTREKEFRDQEKTLHEGLTPHLKNILLGKNLILFRTLLEEEDYPDVHLIDHIIRGFNVTGVTDKSSIFPLRLRPATRSANDIRASSVWSRRAICATVRSTGNLELDAEVWSKTLEERDNGWLSGPFTEQEISAKLVRPAQGIHPNPLGPTFQ